MDRKAQFIDSAVGITYVLCVLYGLMVSDRGMHQLLPMLLPGFAWITWPSFPLGLARTFAYGRYVAMVFAPILNFAAARGGTRKGT